MSSVYSRTPNVIKGWLIKLKRQLPSLDPKDLLPVSLEIVKGAFIIGNESTPTLLVAEYRKSEGTYGIVAVNADSCFSFESSVSHCIVILVQIYT